MLKKVTGLCVAGSLCFLFPLFAAPDEKPVEDLTFANEASFLEKAGSEWRQAAPSVWEKEEIDGSKLQIGFGIASYESALARVSAEWANLASALETETHQGARYFKQKEHLLTLEAEMDFLRRGIESGRKAVASKGTTSDSGLICSGSYQLEATTSTSSRNASGTAEATFYQAGPLSTYQKTLFASVTATSNLGVDSDWFSSTGPFGCCTSVNAQASKSGGACRVESRAYIQISGGCTAYRTITRNEDCPDPVRDN